jgi:uncharacterized protein (TIGR02996 family)
MHDDVAGLLLEVISRPDDDAVHAVLADVLQAAGDPRGELIALQLLAARGNRDRDVRIHELLARHAAEWLGTLCGVTRASRFDRGFPRQIELASAAGWPPEDARWTAALADPALATVDTLVPGTVGGGLYKRFAVSSAMRNLRAIEVYDRASLEALEETPAAVRHATMTDISFDADAHDEDDDPDVATAEYLARWWDACERRTSITSLGLRLQHLSRLIASPWFDRVQALTLGVGSARAGLEQWHRVGARRLTLTSHARLEPCDRQFPWDYKIELVRADERLVARISGEWLLQPVSALEALPSEVERVEIERASDLITMRVREVVARRRVEIVEVPQRADSFVWHAAVR